MITDPISNYLTSIRNALQVKRSFVEVPSSKIKKNITQILEEQGYIDSYSEHESEIKGKKILKIKLKYISGKKESVIKKITRMSKPSLRKYVASDKMPHVLNGLGIAIISTSQGLMTGKKARKQNIGGEIICEIY